MSIIFMTLHVVAAVFIAGPLAILPMVGLRAVREGNTVQAASLAKSTSLLSWLSLIIVVLGFGALGMSDPTDNFSFSDTWVWLSIVLYVVAFVLTMFVVVPALRIAGEAPAVAGDGTVVAAAKPAGYSRIAMGSGISTLLLVVITVLMVAKP
ncbi:DUF2269 domain-containing protein [Subtercola sp. PAMC28395]|uniref:DUF2269 family protein n=1 Tax=Subtercola sp. PAMC28395 TaxID=2846775 RepID=UPI001C0D28F7|nr:DUF2269 family protein [Subtercola sp. PAMC28395]QWT24394.1 DUF2269 domain-containing protein [Subtercola sp. PAMC28395]